jgi:O-antigen/teichoic acid export membrane protein
MQIAVGRFLVFANEKGDIEYANAIVSTAFFVLAVAGVLALIAIGAMSAMLHQAFPAIPPDLIMPARITLLLVGGVLALGLPFMALNGAFAGLQRNEVIAVITGSSRMLLALALVGLVLLHVNMIIMGAAFVLVYSFSYGMQWAAFKRIANKLRLSITNFRRPVLRELGAYCSSMTVWSVSMLMVTGLDTAIVGRVDFPAAAGYAACVGLTTFVGGVQSALFSPILQVAAALHARQASEELGALLIRSTRWCAVILLAVAAPLLLFNHEILRLWLGQRYAGQLAEVLAMLVLGTVLRMIATPYALFLLATAQHRRVYLSPLLEGATNLSVSIIAGMKYGVIGVACGTFVGGVVGQLANYFFNLPRTRHIEVDRQELLQKAIIPPLASFLPILTSWVICANWGDATYLFRLGGIALFAIFSWSFVVDHVDRTHLAQIFSKIFKLKTIAKT